jgi:uncharacterized protein
MTLARSAIVLIFALTIIAIVVRLLESRFAFFPITGEVETPHDFGVDYESVTIQTEDGERLGAWVLAAQAPRALIVYFHGNGGNLSMWAPIVAHIARQGYVVLAVDYRGYGISSGRPSERGLYRDVDAVLEHVRTRMRPAVPVVYWGRSIGATMAAYAAKQRRPAGIILESGFPDARSLFRASPPMMFLALFATYRFSAVDHLTGATVPALVMHGDADTIIPFDRGRALFERITGPKEFFIIRGGDHNDASPPDAGAYWRAVNGFIDRVVHTS